MPTKLAPRLVSWASVLEDSTREQATRAASMPFVYPHLALMPDAHLGKGATVGSVIPTDRAIIPAAVGVDIGCGMIAVRTTFSADDLRVGELRLLRERIEAAVPLSAGKYNSRVTETAARRIAELEDDAEVDYESYAGNWRLQLGTLGSGNHFIEVTLDEEDRVWLFLHSGSRGIGNKIAQRHIAIAAKLCERWWIELPDRDLVYLVEGTDEFWAYLRDLRLGAEVRTAQPRGDDGPRRRGPGRVPRRRGRGGRAHQLPPQLHPARAPLRTRDLGVAQGAIEAKLGQPGLVPGSMGTASYVVVGKGDPVSLCSSPHGAGRAYSRSAARRAFTVDDLRAAMQGIEYRDTDAFLDEIPAAYKDIDQVMTDAADLVEIRHTLHQVVNVKGD